jgi:transmembrane sensor
MTSPSDAPSDLAWETAQAQAARWAAKAPSLREEPADPEFARWREASALNAAAWRDARAVMLKVDASSGEAALERLRARTRARYPSSARRVWPVAAGLGLAACLAVGVTLSVVGPRSVSAPAGDSPQSALRVLANGEAGPVRIALDDGSYVTLDASSHVRVTEWGPQRRGLIVDRGRAYFEVAKDKTRPFVVTCEGQTVTAVGTAFDVQSTGTGVRVDLVEGRVRVAGEGVGDGLLMSAGQSLVVDTAGRSTLGALETQADWRNGQTVFKNAPLDEAVAEMNRYSPRKIVLGQGLATRRISGVFASGDVDQFVRALEAYGMVTRTAGASGEIRLGAPA